MQILPMSCLLFGVLGKAIIYILVPTSFSACRNSFMQSLEICFSGFGAYHPRFLVCHSQEVSGCQDDVTTEIILQCFLASSLLLAGAEHPEPRFFSGFCYCQHCPGYWVTPLFHTPINILFPPFGVPTAFLVALFSFLQTVLWRRSFPASGLLRVFCSHVLIPLRVNSICWGVEWVCVNLQMATRCRSTPAVSVLLRPGMFKRKVSEWKQTWSVFFWSAVNVSFIKI